VCTEWILVAARTTIIGVLYFSPYSCNILHLQWQQTNVVTNVWLMFLRYSLKIESTQFSQKCVGRPQSPSCAPSRRMYPPEPFSLDPSYHRTWIGHWWLWSCIIKWRVWKRFIGDILHIVILDFSSDILTLSVKIWCPGLVQEKL